METPSPELIKKAELAGEAAVNKFLETNSEPFYCGLAYLYYKKVLPLLPRQRKVRFEEVKIRPTGFAGRSQSLDLQEMWCKAAEAVFAQNGVTVYERSWVD